jgi:hypothetical protein
MPAAQDHFHPPDNLSHATQAASPQMGPGGGSPPLGWSDIDGIIQSFVRGQDLSNASAGLAQADLLQQQVPTGPEVQVSNPGSSNFIGNQSWLQSMTGDNNSTSFEDLLFGFNGSALDSMIS